MTKIPDNLKWKATGIALGQGGQGSVYEVTDKTSSSNQKYAMKVLATDRPPSAYHRFVREIEVAKTLDHPCIPKILECSTPESDFHYYVMEYVPGARPLKSLLDSSMNPFRADALASLDLFESIADVIRACESNKYVHRDLSPANILVLEDRSIRIIDFGLCQVEAGTTITLVDEGLGTRDYTAPECESGADEKITSRADLYSAGKVLWSAITGMKAFARESPAFNNKSLKSVLPNWPETWHLHHILEKTVRKNPSDRFRDSSEALRCCNDVRSLIRGGFPPLEMLEEKCPLCGLGLLDKFQGSHMVFGNPNPDNINAYRCEKCGYCFAVDENVANKELLRRKMLE